MFVDEVNILVNAGNGGDGCMAFRREKFVPMGGPYGGSGGKGGDVIFKADSGLKTLIDLKYQKHIKGLNGLNGEGKNKNGKSADDVIIKVPIGTTIKDNNTGLILADLKKNGEEVIVAYGGRGGRGNVSLSTKSNPCPSFCERGEPGEARNINATLRMIADVGLVGLPSVGKSTILSQISAANPKIASYHFTTLSPNLGVVKTKNEKTFVVADLPGLIEGASNGLGLGHKFLKHVERTKIIAHVIDISGSEGRDPYDDYLVINKELQEFNPKLLEKPRIIIANKMDIDGSLDNLREFKSKVSEEVISISALNKDNLEELIDKLNVLVEETEDDVLYEDENVIMVNKPWGILSQKSKPEDISINDQIIPYAVNQGLISEKELQVVKPSICNRLDRNTTGIIICGISIEGLQTMAEMLKHRDMEKYYLCIVKGKLERTQKVSAYLKKDEKTNKVKVSKQEIAGASHIETAYEPVISNDEFTLLKVELITGKTHQIRAHLASIGHPLIGDFKYGDKKINQEMKQRFGLKDQLLHCTEVVFPRDMKTCRNLSGKKIQAPLPKRFDMIKNDLFGRA